ncbi:MAG: histidine kinase [Prevotella sp.]|nr:histidine kinase [Prevotella sp.]
MNDRNKLIYLIHAAIWTVIFLSPLMSFNHGNGVSLREYVFFSVGPLSLFVVFYLNYFWLTPHLFVTNRKSYFWIINVIVIVSMGIALHCWMTFTHPHHVEPHKPDFMMYRPKPFITIFLILRNIFNLTISAAIAMSVQLAFRWHQSETARTEAEAARTEAELKNLRSQINPHFLLNTLNNIYALTAFDTARAQEAILELSKMLRYVLYDNEEQYVSMEKEVQFLTNYVRLMRIRLSADVDVRMNTDIPTPCSIRIAPLIFISLIENAFKHGVSATGPSFIHISLKADNKSITFHIENSNNPKSSADRSGHGIGLQQVATRLEMAYPGKYEWTKGTDNDNKIYSSTIILHDTKLCNN